MKILHISGAKSWGGNEQQLVDIIPELEKNEIENVVFGVKDSPLYTYCEVNKIDFIKAKETKLNKFVNYKFLKKIVNEERPDLIHLHTNNAVTVFVISDILYRLKTQAVFSKKGMGRSMSFLSILKYNYKNIKSIICVSNFVKSEMSKNVIWKKNHYKLNVIYDSINQNRLSNVHPQDIRKLYNINVEDKIIGNIANHTSAKDLITLLKAISFIVHSLNFKNFKLIQIGEFSDLTEDLKNSIRELKIENYVVFTNFIDQGYLHIQYFDVFVISSEREGGPTAALEAFFYRTPVISTKVGVLKECIEDNFNGLLVDVKDYKELAKKIVEVLKVENLGVKLADAAKITLNNKFTIEKITSQLIAEYYKEVNY
ncbi:glycosyltransferase family 4 protein [Aquimarina agarivorans]|uniref:glycosyltransferase family 4 protein n=1 Tax=Aquimarina agarivorans TaxID=980584 RepID=UPI000494F023|nr:glycosyltransferase family 4 protein [Aquimarina agarivorans]